MDILSYVLQMIILLGLAIFSWPSLTQEFLDFQLLQNGEIPESVWIQCIVQDKPSGMTHRRMDIIWHHLSTIKAPDHSNRFARLSQAVKLVIVIPHSNAQEERVFSMIRKNKTSFRPSLDPKGTLSSILTVKLPSIEKV